MHKRIRELRLERGFSQRELGAAIGVSKPTISQWETEGKSNPNGANLQKLAEVLNTTPDFLLYGKAATLKVKTFDNEGLPVVAKQIPILNGEELLNGVFDSEKYLVTSATVSNSAFGFVITNDAMVNANLPISIPEGARCIVDPEIKPKNKMFVLANLNGNDLPTVKQLVEDGSRRYLKPLNNMYSAQEMDDDAIVFGVAVQVITDYELV